VESRDCVTIYCKLTMIRRLPLSLTYPRNRIYIAQMRPIGELETYDNRDKVDFIIMIITSALFA
jgi:hypothetical protein